MKQWLEMDQKPGVVVGRPKRINPNHAHHPIKKHQEPSHEC
jgi:hypothetical protein